MAVITGAAYLALGACAQHPGTPEPGITIAADSPSPTPLETVPPDLQLEYAGTVSVSNQQGDTAEVSVKFGSVSVGEADDVPAEAVQACLSDTALVSRSIFVLGQATVTVTSKLPTDVRLKIGSTFDPVLLGDARVSDTAEGGWQCEPGRLWQFNRSLYPGQPATFDFLLFADILTPDHPAPSQDVLNAWSLTTTAILGGRAFTKTELRGPHVAQCSDLKDLRLSVLATPPYSFVEPERESFGVVSGGLRRCTRPQ